MDFIPRTQLPVKHRARSSFAALGIASCLLLPGCANYSGIHSNSQLAKSGDYAAAQSLSGASGHWPTVNWAKQFGGLQLHKLIDEAIAHNPSIAQAHARLAAATAYAQGANAQRQPTVDGGYSLSQTRFSANALYPPPYGGHWYTDNNVLLNASFDLDLWGKHRQQALQALSNEKAAQAATQQAKLTLAVAVAHTYNQLVYESALRRITAQVNADRRQLSTVANRSVDSGIENPLEHFAAAGDLSNSRATLSHLNGQIKSTRYQLAALLGKGPDRGLAIKEPSLARSGFTRTLTLPNHLPADLVARRPDLTAARWAVEAASQGINASKAEFYPDLNLSAEAGLEALGFSRFLNVGSRQFAAGPAVHLPIFDAGALRANLRGAYAAYDEAVAHYNQTLIDALSEVARTVAAIRSTDAQLDHARAAYAAAHAQQRLLAARYRAGLVPQTSTLAANLHVLQEEQTVLALRMQRRDQQMSLLQALGGGYHSPSFK